MDETNITLDQCIWIAIVKDEIDNLAGGIAETSQRVLPHVGAAIILDTGSTDGTLEILEDLERRYDHLHVASLDHPFSSFSDARNASLDAAYRVAGAYPTVTHGVIIDADETVDPESWRALNDILQTHDNACVCFGIETVDGSGEPIHRSNNGMLNPRCFPLNRELRFEDQVGSRFERLMFGGESIPREWMVRNIGVSIIHYIPGQKARQRKTDNYRQQFGGSE